MKNENEATESEANRPSSGSALNCLVMRDFHSVKETPPPTGTLCIVYLPIGVNVLTNKTTGASAIAYKTATGWKMADEPTALRGLMKEACPAYWCELKIDHTA